MTLTERVQRALDDLQRDGVLSDAQRAAVAERLAAELPARGDRVATFVRIVAMLGALLVGAGILLFFAANWEEMGKPFKLALIFALFLGVHHFGFALAEQPGRSPALGRALTALGVLLFGGAIGLIAQIYHLSSDYPWALLLWWTTSVPFVLLTRSRAVTTAVLGLFLLWLGWHAGWRLDRAGTQGDERWLVALATLGMCTGALLRGLSLVLRGSRFAACEQPPRLLAAPCVLGGMYALSFGDVFHLHEGSPLPLHVFETPLAVGVPAVVLLAFAARRAADRVEAAVGAGSLLAAALFAWWMSVAPESVHLVANASLFVALLVLIAVGVKRNAPSSINYGILGFLGLVVTRYVEYVGSEMNPFLAFIFGGVVLLAMGTWLERKRRGWIAAAEGAS
ncbi:MAG: DUF2157 domain-containing protein [Planctomycetes bacterium]|nr:DUF2157 domain-containing protein [Planctomycetota bacterium]